MNAILSILKEHKLESFITYPIKSPALFGSYSRADFKINSDVDIMAEIAEPSFDAFCNSFYNLKKNKQESWPGLEKGYKRKIL